MGSESSHIGLAELGDRILSIAGAASTVAVAIEIPHGPVVDDWNGQVQSRAARSRDSAIQMACELLEQSHVVRRAVGPDGATIERAELQAYYDEGRFPGLRHGKIP